MILPVPHESTYPLLYKPSRDLTPEEIKSPEIKKFIGDLIETMYYKNGVGIASIQVANPIALCIIAKDFTPGKKADLVLINPQFEKASILRDWDEEGCLSVPKIYGKVRRYKKIKVTALDVSGKKIQFVASNFFARICQHEIDHLNGVLYISKAKNLRSVEKEVPAE
jgi:peptide deformylase